MEILQKLGINLVADNDSMKLDILELGEKLMNNLV